MRRSLLFSCALHAAIVLIAFATAPRRAARESASAVEIAFDAPAPPSAVVAVDVDTAARTGGGGPAQPAEPAAFVSARVHRRRPAPIATAVETPPAPAPGLAAPPVSEDGAVPVAKDAPAPGPADAPADQATGAGDGKGAGAGNGLGDGLGDGFGPGAGGPAMGRELHARVLGNEVVDVRPREGAPTISHDEATALRTRDSFPRLPESVWPQWRPYIVKLEICVGEDGGVREAVLRSSASPRLDPLVLAAAKTWRYRPRLVDGKAAPFCHGVVIKYERW
jgi:hypothetical protein